MAEPRLMALPDELIESISKHLTFSATIALRWTSRRFYYMVKETDADNEAKAGKCKRFTSPLRILALDKMHDLLLIERWPAFNALARVGAMQRALVEGYESIEMAEKRKEVKQRWEDMYACCHCLRLRSASAFTTAMTKGKRGKLSDEQVANGQTTGQTRRHCIKCGIKEKRYFGGALLQLADDFPLRPQDDSHDKYVSAIVCRKCSTLYKVAADSQEQFRRTCSNCLAYRPPKLK